MKNPRVPGAPSLAAWCLRALAVAAALSARPGPLPAAPAAAATPKPVTFPSLRPLPIEGAADDSPLFRCLDTGDPGRIVATTRFGDVTAGDLYLHNLLRDDGTDPLALDRYDKARAAGDKQAAAATVRAQIDDYVFVQWHVPARMGAAPCDSLTALREALYVLPAYQMAYIQRIIEPTLILLPTDRQKYLQEHAREIVAPERFRVRVIRLPGSYSAPYDAQDATETSLTAIRADIAAGRTTFEAAARRHSKAPSAARGGEIPMFARGELFFFFEDAVAALQPGEVSLPFRGPDGSHYLAKLMERVPAETPDLCNPVHAAKVEDGLRRQVLRATYAYERGKLAKDRLVFQTQANQWDERKDDEEVARVEGGRDFSLTKSDVRNLYPEIEGDDLTLAAGKLSRVLTATLKRWVMQDEVLRCHPEVENELWMVRARGIAANMARATALAFENAAAVPSDEPILRAFHARNPALFTPLPQRRVAQLTLKPAAAPAPGMPVAAGVAADCAGELRRISTALARGQAPDAPPAAVAVAGAAPVNPEELLRSLVRASAGGQAGPGGSGGMAGAVNLPAPTGQLQPVIVLPDTAAPPMAPLAGDGAVTVSVTVIEESLPPPAPAPAPVPAPVPFDPATTAAAVPTPAPMATPAPAVRPSGPAASGATPTPTTFFCAEIATASAAPDPARLRPASPGAIEPYANPDPPSDPDDDPALRPTVVSFDAPPAAIEVPAAAGTGLLEGARRYSASHLPGPAGASSLTPRRPRRVPAEQAIPFNPGMTHARKSSLPELRAAIDAYNALGTGAVLVLTDLGYVYPIDNPALAAALAAVPDGVLSPPGPSGSGAASFISFETRQPPVPPYEAIRSRVYSAYRNHMAVQGLRREAGTVAKAAGTGYVFDRPLRYDSPADAARARDAAPAGRPAGATAAAPTPVIVPPAAGPGRTGLSIPRETPRIDIPTFGGQTGRP